MKNNFDKILSNSINEYNHKTKMFNSRPTVLFCTNEELASICSMAKIYGFTFDCCITNTSTEIIMNYLEGKHNCFFSNSVISSALFKHIANDNTRKHIYIGPTKNEYFDLYPHRNIIYNNLDKINIIYNYLIDEKSKRTFLNIITRLCVDYHFHYFYEPVEELQYFPKEFIFSNNEVYLDAGVCDGQDIVNFTNLVGSKYKYIYGFEPDESNYSIAESRLYGIKSLELRKLALYSHSNLSLKFRSSVLTGKRGNARIQPDGDILVNTIKGDSLDVRPTFIKMDIEGAEKEALIGLENTIKNHSPKLAVCIYHFQNDFWEIPLLIKKLNPEYKIMIRNYENLSTLLESVCYAYM